MSLVDILSARQLFHLLCMSWSVSHVKRCYSSFEELFEVSLEMTSVKTLGKFPVGSIKEMVKWELTYLINNI